jgi:uncharacterized protein (TIGR02588 family)
MTPPIKKNLLEWSVFAVSSLILLALVGYLGCEVIAGASTPPSISVRIGESIPVEHGYRVRVDLHNRGKETASGVQVVLALRTNGTTEESATAEVPFLPRGARRSVAVLFRRDPSQGHLSVASIAFEHP